MKKQIATLACLFLFLSALAVSAAERYFPVGEADQGKYYLDTQTILYNNGKYRFWGKYVLSESGRKELVEKQTTKKEKNRASQISHEFMCFEVIPQMMEFRVLSFASYSAKGTKLISDTFNANWEPIIPGTIVESFLRSVLLLADLTPEVIKIVK